MTKSNISNTGFCSGFGRYHTTSPQSPNPKAYNTITYAEILELAKKPPTVPKEKAQWVIPSTLLSRVKAEQLADGEFHFLALDLDDAAPPLTEIASALHALMGDVSSLYYSSKSATECNPKCHVLIPVATDRKSVV